MVKETKSFRRTKLFRILSILGRAWLQFRQDHCLVRASGLAFMSFLTLVPFLAFIFSLLSRFGAFDTLVDKVQEYLFTILMPTKQQIIYDVIGGFINNAKAAGYFGLFFFMLVAVFFINNIVSNVNAVWGTHYTGRFLSKFTAYMSSVIFICLILGVTISLVTLVQPIFSKLDMPNISILNRLNLLLVPSIFVFLTELFLIVFTPFTRVNVKSALLGAALGTLFWEIAKRIFAFLMNSVVRMSFIYGSITVLLLFMIWLYIAWGVLLYSLEITYVHQFGLHSWAGKPSIGAPPITTIALGFDIYFYIARAFIRGEKPPQMGSIIRKFYTGGVGIPNMIRVLRKNNIIAQTETRPRGYIPGKDLSTVTVKELGKIMIGVPFDFTRLSQAPDVVEILTSMSEGSIEVLPDMTVEKYLAQDEKG